METDLLSPEQEVTLAKRISEGDMEARDHMIRANLRLVVKIARDYADYGVPLADLISEGNIGLMKGVEKFDPEKGGKLSTYAAWWIKQSIKRALSNQGKTIRLPVHVVDKISRVRRIGNLLAEELGREPKDDELADELGISRKKLALLKQSALTPASLDAPVGEDGEATYGEKISDANAVSPYEALSRRNIQKEVDGLLLELNDREQRIIHARFGLGGKKPMTLEEVSRDFGVTRERIRQLQNIALSKMKKALCQKERDPRRLSPFSKLTTPTS